MRSRDLLYLIGQVLLVLLFLVATLASFGAEWLVKQRCRWLLQPSKCQAYEKAKAAIPLKKNFGYLIEYEGNQSQELDCLYVHGCRGNANDWLETTLELCTKYRRVFVFEPRGFGPCQLDPSLASIIAGIRVAFERIQRVTSKAPCLVAQHMGASLARFSVVAFKLKPPRCEYRNRVDWRYWMEKFQWLKQCRTFALSSWSSILPFEEFVLEQ